jgi:glutamate 5-kinase
VNGLYDDNPKENPQAKLIHDLPRVTSAILARTSRSAGSSRGTGGMYSKLSAAQRASSKGIETWLVRGDLPSVLIRVAEDERVGTRIGKPRRQRS